MKLVCLLPVRNGEADLPGFFESAARFADAVIALDDGSDDETLSMLRREPLVVQTLTNPVRHGFAGWHDAANRNRLLEAVAAHEPDWVISIDADERIDPIDAVALRQFLETDALPGLAYGFRCFSMVGGLERALPTPIWVYRLFAFAAGQCFSDQQLHFAPIPTAIPRQAFVRTSLRIQHLGGMSSERRLARYEKYRQVDPGCRFWPDYAGLLKEPDPNDLIEWLPRAPDAPIIFSGEAQSLSSTSIEASPARFDISIVVLNDGTESAVRRAIESVVAQRSDRVSIDILVVTRAGAPVPLGSPRSVTVAKNAIRGAMRNAGLAAAGGRHVVFLDADVALLPGAVEQIESGFDRGFAAVAGTIIDQSSGFARATYVDRFGMLRDGNPESILESAVPWAAYSSELLAEIGGFNPSLNRDEDWELGQRIVNAGYVTLRLDQPVAAYSGGMIATRLAGLADAFARGRAQTRHQLSTHRDRGELFGRAVARRTGARRAVPDTKSSTSLDHLAVAAGHSAGKWFELTRPERGKATVLFGRPGGIALVVAHRLKAGAFIGLVRFDLNKPELRVVELPGHLLVPAADGRLIELGAALGSDEGPKGATWFAVNDAVGRPFDIEIDEIISIDGASDAGRTLVAESRRHMQADSGRIVIDPGRVSSLVSTWRAAIADSGIETTLSRRALALALLRLSRMTSDQVKLIRPFGDDDVLDAEGVELVRSFLAPDQIKRPRTAFSTLRTVEWA